MNVSKPVEKLYHYTSINSLALILQSKSIRLGRLDKVNDPTEGLSSDFHSMAQYFFISSWTSNSLEDFALWNMYTPLMRGVRIELELPLFPTFSIRKDINNSLVDANNFINYKEGYFIASAENTPVEIIYTNDESLLTPSIKLEDGLFLKALSQYKRSVWKIEQEYRYQLIIMPIDRNIEPLEVGNSYSRLLSIQTPPPLDTYFLEIRKQAFQNMKICLSPKLLAGDRAIIEALVNTYNPSAIIQESTVSGFIR
ncbi:hypothetical protein HDC92_001607 [Pedobacter sp. AK017]|uniref:DUF2971 domain-containing protein n=1 Tax=Pedobacter sp. AK017 TaxID=2723073 RepID=UPI0016083A16|nr:DUF2971 domain-containing protein [Pedobacter sp. AK017]MBB5437933.1 hypothetical protein [Pedobacter sp. AK017]